VFRRSRLPAHLEERLAAFESLIPDLEAAKAALTEAVPGTRLPGRPLAEALATFEEGLRSVRPRMAGWRADELEDAWAEAAAGLDEALARAERLRLQASGPAGFEGLIGTVSALLEPLEPFGAAAERFRELRFREPRFRELGGHRAHRPS
jgi:hypothetical protein